MGIDWVHSANSVLLENKGGAALVLKGETPGIAGGNSDSCDINTGAGKLRN